MKTMIFCEGTTDLLMIQYVLQYKYGWHYNGFLENSETNRLRKKTLKRDTDIVDIESCGGITNIPKRMQVLFRVHSFWKIPLHFWRIYDSESFWINLRQNTDL